MRSTESNQSKIILRFVSKFVINVRKWPKTSIKGPKMSKNGRKLVKKSLAILMKK